MAEQRAHPVLGDGKGKQGQCFWWDAFRNSSGPLCAEIRVRTGALWARHGVCLELGFLDPRMETMLWFSSSAFVGRMFSTWVSLNPEWSKAQGQCGMSLRSPRMMRRRWLLENQPQCWGSLTMMSRWSQGDRSQSHLTMKKSPLAQHSWSHRDLLPLSLRRQRSVPRDRPHENEWREDDFTLGVGLWENGLACWTQWTTRSSQMTHSSESGLDPELGVGGVNKLRPQLWTH